MLAEQVVVPNKPRFEGTPAYGYAQRPPCARIFLARDSAFTLAFRWQYTMAAATESSEYIDVNSLKDLIGELRMMARHFLSGEQTHSFTPTALAMTALRRAKLSDQDWSNVRWENRAHFFSALTTAMRHALIDHARRKKARGRHNILYFAPNEDVFLDLAAEVEDRPARFILVDEALAKLQAEDRRLSDVIERFYFLGYTSAEITAVSRMSDKTVDRDLKRARTILRKYMDEMTAAAG